MKKLKKNVTSVDHGEGITFFVATLALRINCNEWPVTATRMSDFLFQVIVNSKTANDL